MAAVLVFSIVALEPCAYAASTPSKTEKDQRLESRASELALARVAYAPDRIVNALQKEGFTPEQVQARVAALSTFDVVSLTRNPAQIKSAGVSMSRKVWTIASIAAGAVAVGAFALHQKDDGENPDGSDDGED